MAKELNEQDLTEAGGKTRLYVTSDLGANRTVALGEGQTHYLLHVLRAKAGNRVLLFNGRDGEWLAEIAQAGKRGTTATCLRQTQQQARAPDIWLVFAPVKKTPSDYLVQKAAELGVSCLLPVFTRRTIVARINEERMAANAIEAAEQSARLSVPEIREGVALEKL
ncbi:MAG TPA: RsmE family RNA methyltransferase, partial [Rhizomicrobium sp.]|nr:RsmE family RNA methyltransferase [Rhizomicrobium sp.]